MGSADNQPIALRSGMAAYGATSPPGRVLMKDRSPHPLRTLQFTHLTASAVDRCREAEGDVAIRVRPQMAARHRRANVSALGSCVYIRVVLFYQNIACVFDNR